MGNQLSCQCPRQRLREEAQRRGGSKMGMCPRRTLFPVTPLEKPETSKSAPDTPSTDASTERRGLAEATKKEETSLETKEKSKTADDKDPDIAKIEEVVQKSHPLIRIVTWACEEKWWWAGSYTLIIVNSVLGALTPQMFMNVVQAVATPQGKFVSSVGQLMAMTLVITGTSTAQSLLSSEATFRMNMRIKKHVLTNMLNQEMGFFDATQPAELITQVNSTGSACAVMSAMIPTFMSSIVKSGTTYLILSRIDSRLALVTLVSVPFEIWMSFRYSKMAEKASEQMQEVNARTGSTITETMSSIRAIRSLHAEKRQAGRFLQQLSDQRALQVRQRKMLTGQTIISTLVPHATGIFILFYGGILVKAGVIDITGLMTVNMYQQTLQGALGNIFSLYISWGTIVGSTRKVFTYIDRVPKCRPRGTLTPVQPIGDMELRNVKFSYPTSKGNPVLENFNLSIKKGENVAIVGPSGGGKSTMINLLMGLYDPTEGEVLIDGIPITDYDVAYLYTLGIAVVSQTPQLFRGSIRENITFGMSEHHWSDEEVIAAAKLANAHEFIMEMEDGYETDLGANGNKLSGGQRQRIAIARAIVRNPAILLLDEPTSALDNRCEAAVKDALMNVMKGRTVIVVAHRLTTIRHFPRIVVMDKGALVEEGSHEELIAKNGLYRQLYTGVTDAQTNQESTRG